MPRTPLFDPGRYFAERERLPVGYAAAVIVSFWVVSTIALTAFAKPLDPTAGLATSPATIGLTQTVIVAAYAAGTLWLLLAVSLHYVAASTGGDGRFFDALAITGWTFAVPQLLAPFLVPLSIHLARASSGSYDRSAVIATLFDVGLVDVSLAVVATWTIVVWAYGLERRYGLPFWGAAVTAATIVGAALLVVVALTHGAR